MKKVEISRKYLHLFQEYKHSIPVIHSTLEGQYEGKLFVDSEKETQAAILFTRFAFHFVAGNPEIENIVDVLDEVIFQQYLPESGENEAVVFCPNHKWDKILDAVFAKHHGIKEDRKMFRLNKDKYKEAQTDRINLLGVRKTLRYEQENGANKKYPVCRIMDDEECISWCSGFMLGNGHAEIDVFTKEEYRGKGYGKEVSISLINELLKHNIEPDWCTWPYRVESEKLARSLGYELVQVAPAHIWVEEKDKERQ